jgi:hypothetical protein
MASQLTSEELKRLARLGALARLQQLEDERRAILRAFPGLTAPGTQKAPIADGQSAQEAAGAPKKARTRRKMTAAERKAASERMKRYWAARKQG